MSEIKNLDLKPILDSYSNIQSIKLPLPIVLAIIKYKKKIIEIFDVYNETRKQFIESRALKNEHGVICTESIEGVSMYKFSTLEEKAEVLNQLADIDNSIVSELTLGDRKAFKESEVLGSVKEITPIQLDSIRNFIEILD